VNTRTTFFCPPLWQYQWHERPLYSPCLPPGHLRLLLYDLIGRVIIPGNRRAERQPAQDLTRVSGAWLWVRACKARAGLWVWQRGGRDTPALGGGTRHQRRYHLRRLPTLCRTWNHVSRSRFAENGIALMDEPYSSPFWGRLVGNHISSWTGRSSVERPWRYRLFRRSFFAAEQKKAKSEGKSTVGW